MKYYVIYESYTEYNQFEGSWDFQHEEFETFEEARDFTNSPNLDANQYNRIVIGPLVLADENQAFDPAI